MKLLGGQRTESTWLYAVAGILLVAGPLWHELFVNRYPLRPEAVVLLLLAAGLGALVALGSRFAGGIAGALVFGGLIFLFLDLQFDLHNEIRTVYIVVASLVLSLLIATHRAAITSLALGAFYLSSLIRPGTSDTMASAARTGDATRPLLLHVILDEQWGVGGLRAAGDSTTADFLTRFYVDRGFVLHDAAYSHYEMTEESIPASISLGQPPAFSPDSVRDGQRYFVRMRAVPYFEKLRDLGYAIRAYQSTYLDVCGDTMPTVSSCDVSSGNSIANIGQIDGSWVTRGLWVARYYLETRSHVADKLLPEATTWSRSVAGGAISSMQRLTSAIESGPPGGVAYFAHVLLPHRPVQMDEHCRVLDDHDQMVGYHIPHDIDQDAWRAILRAYAGQVRCAHQLLGEMIDAVDRVAGPGRSIIIVHGDHGSRMQRREPSAERPDVYDTEQLNSAFPTLLAIRRPGTAASIVREPIPVQDFIQALAEAMFGEVSPRPWTHELYRKADSVTRILKPVDMAWAQ